MVHCINHAGDSWRLHVTVNARGFRYDLTAADILRPDLPQGADAVHSAMRGRLTSATFWGWDPFRMVRQYDVDSSPVSVPECICRCS